MTDRRNEGGGLSRCRDAGIAEALLRLGPEAAVAILSADSAFLRSVFA